METPVLSYSNTPNDGVNPSPALTTGVDPSLSYLFQSLSLLSPSSQDLVTTMVNQLAQREGINVAATSSHGLQVPEEGIDLWLIHLRRKRRSPDTVETYHRVLRAYLKLDPIPSRLSVEKTLAGYLDRVSPSRVKTIRSAIRSFFGFIHDQGLWPTKPVERLEGIPVPKRERRVPEDHEIAAVLQQRTIRRTDDAKFRIITILLIDTGMRRQECERIKIVDIDFKTLFIRLIGKGDKERWVPMSPETAVLLDAYVREHTRAGNPYIFPNTRKGGAGHTYIEGYAKSLKLACQKAGVPPISPHQLRHYFATASIRSGAKLHVISRILGHAFQAITADVYVHTNREDMEQSHQQHSPLAKKWLRKSEQGDKWNRCLIEGMIVLSETGARDEQTTPP